MKLSNLKPTVGFVIIVITLFDQFYLGSFQGIQKQQDRSDIEYNFMKHVTS